MSATPMSLFDMDKHRLRVMTEMVLTAASGGAIAAIVASVSDPQHFNWFDLTGLKELGKVAVGGALTGVIFLLRALPRDPASFERRQDAPQVEKAAEKLVNTGEIPPIVPKKP